MITRLNPTNQIQNAILRALRNDPALRALIPRIYPPQAPNSPVRPFVLYGSAITTPRKVDGGDCADVSVAIHCFADSTPIILDGRAFADNVASHIMRILDDLDIPLDEDGMTLKVYPQQAQCLQDGDASSWHSFVTVRAEAS